MINKIKNWFKFYLNSRQITLGIIEDIKRVDKTKWYHPMVERNTEEFKKLFPNGQTYGTYKHIKGKPILDEKGQLIEDDGPIPNLYIRKHPDLDYEMNDLPLSAYPIREDSKLLTRKDIEKITKVFRDIVYK